MTNKVKNKTVVKNKPGNSTRFLRSTSRKSVVKNLSFESSDSDNSGENLNKSDKLQRAKELGQYDDDFLDPFKPRRSLARDDNTASGENKVSENNIEENIKDNTSPFEKFLKLTPLNKLMKKQQGNEAAGSQENNIEEELQEFRDSLININNLQNNTNNLPIVHTPAPVQRQDIQSLQNIYPNNQLQTPIQNPQHISPNNLRQPILIQQIPLLNERLNQVPGENQNMAHEPHGPQIESIKYKDAAKVVKEFNGYNLDVEDFLNSVELGARLIPGPSHATFINYIKLNKLSGEAVTLSLQRTHNTLEEFKNFLRHLYRPKESVYELQGRLAMIYQFLNENVCSFKLRVSDLAKRIKENYAVEIEDEHLEIAELARRLRDFNNQTDRAALNYFLKGLKKEIKSEMTPQADFRSTAELAANIEKEQLKYEERRGGVQPQFNNQLNKNISFTGINKSELKDEIDAKISHLQESFITFTEKLDKKLEEKLAEKPVVTCVLCKKIGHNIDDCYSNPFNKNSPKRGNNRGRPNSQNSQQWCNNCKSNTHSQNNCFRSRNNQQNSRFVNQRNNNSNNDNNTSNRFCDFCDSHAHRLEDCKTYVEFKQINLQQRQEKFSKEKNSSTPHDSSAAEGNRQDQRSINFSVQN